MDDTTSPSHSAPDRVTALLRGIFCELRLALGKFGLAPLIGVLLHQRLKVAVERIERMVVRFRAGKMMQHAPRVQPTERVARKPYTKPELRLPRSYGWLLGSGKHHAAYFTTQLRMLMDEPDMQAFIAASPQAKLVLRPLFRALAVAVPWIAEDPHTGKRPPRARKPRKPRPTPEPFRHPLPRGALSAARRHQQLDAAIKLKHETVLKMAQARHV
jgi:hypothetical protein